MAIFNFASLTNSEVREAEPDFRAQRSEAPPAYESVVGSDGKA